MFIEKGRMNLFHPSVILLSQYHVGSWCLYKTTWKKKNLSTITWVKLNSKFEKEVSCRLSDILSGKATVLSSQCNNFQSIIESAGSQRDRNRLNSAFGFVSGFRDLKPVVSFWLLQCIKRKLNSSTAEASWDRISCTALKSSAWFCFVGYILYNSFLTQLVRIDSFYFNILYLLHYVCDVMWWLNSFPTKQLRENSVRLPSKHQNTWSHARRPETGHLDGRCNGRFGVAMALLQTRRLPSGRVWWEITWQPMPAILWTGMWTISAQFSGDKTADLGTFLPVFLRPKQEGCFKPCHDVFPSLTKGFLCL